MKKENQELLKLQEEFEQGLIKERDLSKEQISSLEKLYNKQIEELNQSLLEYKNKIIAIRKKLVS